MIKNTDSDVNSSCISDSKIFAKIDKLKFYNAIKEVDWNVLFDIEDVNSLYNKFVELLQSIYRKCEKVSKVYKTTHGGINWISDKILNAIKEKKIAWSKCKKDHNNILVFNDYKILRNKVNSLIRREKRLYYKKTFDSIKGDMKKIWKEVNMIITKKANVNVNLNKNFENSNSLYLANKFCYTFVNQINNLVDKNFINSSIDHSKDMVTSEFTKIIKKSSKDCNKYMESVFIPDIDNMQLYKIMSGMKCKINPGIDGVKMSDLKDIFPLIGDVLVFIINKIILCNEFPNILKTAVYYTHLQKWS